MYDTISTGNVPIKSWTRGVPVEEAAVQQLRNTAALPFIHHHIAAMPDVHFGIGATVGSVIPTVGAIVPAAVGVDVGCGMLAEQTSLTASDLPDSLAAMRAAIEAKVPVGKMSRSGLTNMVNYTWLLMEPQYDAILQKHPKIKPNTHPSTQVGTLGGGNHFIELCLDTDDQVWIMLHSGSRGVGNRIGSYFIEQAREEMMHNNVHLPDRDLAYLTEGSALFRDYVEGVGWAQDYAAENRRNILIEVLAAIQPYVPIYSLTGTHVNCHHNYVAKEHHFGADVWLTRKGAVSARAGELGIIPGSMGTKSYIVRGLGNPESFNSCSHGAGRRMSRGVAKRTFTVEDHALATAGVECRKDAGVLDETPGAYKDVDAVLDAQADLVEITHTLRAVLCVKG